MKRMKTLIIVILFLAFYLPIFPQSVLENFDGISWTGKRPPDPGIAVGGNYVVMVVNSKIAVFNKTGTQISIESLNDFFTSVSPPGTPFDPKIVYDHFSNRWVVYALSRSDDYTISNYLIAVSQNTDPTSDWYFYKFNARKDNSTNTNNWADFTGLGYNQEAIYITSNQLYIYGTGGFQYAKIRAIKKSDMYSGEISPTFRDFVNMKDMTGNTVKSIKPVKQFGSTNEFYLMNTATDISADYVTVWSITDPFGSNPIITRKATVNVGRYDPPSEAVQKNSSYKIDTFDSGISDCVYKDGYLYGSFTVKNSTANGSAIKYFK